VKSFMSEIIKKLSELSAKQRLVPFIGAGCSVRMMPDWNTLMSELAVELGIQYSEDSNNADVAQKYVEQFGRDKFCEFLKNRLLIDEFDDEKAFIHLTVMNMGVPSIYTTNQDNVMEMGYEKFGRPYRVITQLKDFADIRLSEQLYIKFHGDLNYPDTIVFTTDDFDKRKNFHNHPLNIRLRADLLAKNLLFIGYSFRDVNIREMFSELREAFYGNLPESYMIAYQYSEELQDLCDEFGIVLIDPMKEFAEGGDHAKAFEKFLITLLEFSRIRKVDDEITQFFTPNVPRPQKVVSKQEIEMLENALPKLELSSGVKMFREIFDASIIPLDFEERAVSAYINLCKKAREESDTHLLSAAIFNLKIEEKLNKYRILSALMATANVRLPKGIYGEDRFSIVMRGIDRRIYTVVAAKAIQYVYSWGMQPKPPLVWNVSDWIDSGVSYDSLAPELQRFVMSNVEKMRKDCVTVAEHPVHRQRRLRERNVLPENELTAEEEGILIQLVEDGDL